MGDSIEQWRAIIGLWSGGKSRKSVIIQHQVAQEPNHICYGHIRFLVLVSLLVIGCVELNPGPNNEPSASSETDGATSKYCKRSGSVGIHGGMYEVKMAAFLFARGLNRTEEFHLASNVGGAGDFDDLVFGYKLREPDVWKTCFIQLKHKKGGGTIRRSSLTQISGKFSLLKYFKSYCKIKINALTHPTLTHCGRFEDFEFVIYTNEKMESKPPLQERDCDLGSILSSRTGCGKYITFVENSDTDIVENSDTDIFEFFEELGKYYKFIRELDSLLEGTNVDKDILLKIQIFESSVRNKDIKRKLKNLKLNMNQDNVTKMMEEVSECNFALSKEFLSKIKIFHMQSNEETLNGLIEKELQNACKASLSVTKFIHIKFENGFYKWWQRDRKGVWLNKNSEIWQTVQKEIIDEVKNISKPEFQEVERCGLRFTEKHIKKLSDAIQQNTITNIVTNSKIRNVQKLKTYQALNILGYKNSLFIGIKSLKIQSKEIKNFWPCKWIDVLVVDCDSEDNVAHTVLDILQQATECGKILDISDDITAGKLIEVLDKYQQKLILISTRHKGSGVQKQLRNDSYFEDNCDITDMDVKSQNQILERPVKFQGTSIPLLTLIGTDHLKNIKSHVDSDVISNLLSEEHELSVGRDLCDYCKHYVPRVLQHQIYLKEDILKLTDKEITFAVTGLQAEELKKYLPSGEKIWEFVYDERELNHTFKIVYDFSKSELGEECGTVKARQKVGRKRKHDKVMYNIFGNKNSRIKVGEGKKINFFSSVAKRYKAGFSAEMENMEPLNNASQNIKAEEVKYIIFGNKNPESEFRELKERCRNVHWIHVKEGSFLWRDANCDIKIVRSYIDKTECEKYDMKSVVEHKDRTMLLVAEPGMGKSTFLSFMAHQIKKLNNLVWVLRINLNEHTNEFKNIEFEKQCIDKCKKFLWNAAHSSEQVALNVTKELFFQALEQRGKMVIILDGFDEICPGYSHKVKMLIRAIRDKTASKIWISSRFSCREVLEDIVGKFAFTLQPFTSENQIQFLEQCWSGVTETSNKGNLHTFVEKLHNLCSHNFSDKDGEFTGIPLQTMMLGEAFVNEAKEYCCSGEFNLPEKFNLLSLFNKFTEKKFDIYFIEKNKMDTSKLEVQSIQTDYVEKHMISALLYLFSTNKLKWLRGAINSSDLEQTKRFLGGGKAENIGIITEIINGVPHFIHRCFAEYFAAKWLADTFRLCDEFISNILFNSTYEIIRKLFDRMLAEGFEIHDSVLKNDICAPKELLNQNTDINLSDNGGRTALHLAASYNRKYIQELLSFPGINTNVADEVLKWTPLRYADRTKSWMAIDMLLQNGANPYDIIFTRRNAKFPEWGQAALWECASKGYKNLLQFLLNCGLQVNANINIREKADDNCTLLHRASYCGQVEVVRLLVNHDVDINIRNAKTNTALHIAAESGSVDIIRLLLDKGMSVNLTNRNKSTPLHVSAECGHLKTMQTLVERGAAINNTNIDGHTPLMVAAYNGKLEVFRYLAEQGADINIRDDDKNTALHLASASGSVDIIRLLLDKGMSVNVIDRDKSTPLHVSAEYGHLEVTETLVETGAAINYINIDGHTPLMVAAYKDKLEIFRYLTEKGADINISDDDNNTALHFAGVSGSVDIINFLLDKGMSVNLTDRDNSTVLHVAAEFGHMEATKRLFERGAGINNINIHGNTPLMIAAHNGKLQVCRYLTEIGADTNIRDEDNNTALRLASATGSVDIIRLLLDKEALF